MAPYQRTPAHRAPIVWENSAQVATRIHRDPCTVRRRAEAGILHGHQTGPRGKWVFAAQAVDVHVQGGDLRAQIVACGCEAFGAARRAG